MMTLVILIFEISKFRKIGRSTFRDFEIFHLRNFCNAAVSEAIWKVENTFFL